MRGVRQWQLWPNSRLSLKQSLPSKGVALDLGRAGANVSRLELCVASLADLAGLTGASWCHCHDGDSTCERRGFEVGEAERSQRWFRATSGYSKLVQLLMELVQLSSPATNNLAQILILFLALSLQRKGTVKGTPKISPPSSDII